MMMSILQKNNVLSWALLLVLVVTVPTTQAKRMAFRYDDATCNSNVYDIELTKTKVTCYGDNYCEPGDPVQVVGKRKFKSKYRNPNKLL